jgi:hypothetical protein
MRLGPALLLVPLLAACTAVPPATAPTPEIRRPPPVTGVPPTRPVAPPATQFRSPEIQRVPGLENVLEQTAAGLTRLFGAPRLDVREGDARKLQFVGTPCVLDVFLYPLRPGAEPIATYVEARRASDGAEVDKVACVQALARR